MTPPPLASTLTAVLGPTNTGKTHRAIERMLAHPTGMLGLPLRLLAREVYDRVTARIGEGEVALVTGEEKRVPARPRYWVCTVEAMPIEREVDFVGIDEIQLVAHPERGHVFTDRLLHARGREETWFLGSDTARGLVAQLAPTARIQSHPRLSKLRAVGRSSLAGLPPRSAVVAFSATRVYELAERLRQQRGGAAVVLGALSPRARNAQVALYQSGEVDYLVATDAVGMGLNLDVLHVAFADVRKFDGRESRPLDPAELSQIAGRAGRYLNDGTFGTVSPLEPFSDATSRAIEAHAFPPLTQAFYRNSDLDLSSIVALAESLRARPRARCLKVVTEAADTTALAQLGARDEIRERATIRDGVALLWDVCRIPDFRDLLLDHHVNLLAEIFLQLSGRAARLDPDWMAQQVSRIDDPEGDIETLLMRMAAIRTFTYISHHEAWLDAPREWQERTRAIEDRLSDALHLRLVARFVDRGGSGRRLHRRATVRARARLNAPGGDDAGADPGHPFARLLALREALARTGTPLDPKASEAGWVEALIDAPHSHFQVDERGRLSADGRVVGKLTPGADLLHPEVTVTLDELGSGARSRVQRRLVAWARDLVHEMLRPLAHDALASASAATRGLLHQLRQRLGTVRTDEAREQLGALTEADRRLLEELGVRLGRHTVHLPELVTEEGIRRRVALCVAFGARVPVTAQASASVEVEPGFERDAYTVLGYVTFGARAIRADVAERVSAALQRASGTGAFDLPTEIGEWLGCTATELGPIIAAFGYARAGESRFVRRSRRRRRRRRSPRAAQSTAT